MLYAGSPELPPVTLERLVPTLYLLIALPLTLMLCVLTGPFFGPDEQHHAARAIALAHGLWSTHPGPTGEEGAGIDTNALAVMDDYDRLRMDWEKLSYDFHNRTFGPLAHLRLLPDLNTRWSGQTAFAPFPNTAVYPPVLYLPAMLGWRIAEALNLTILHSLHLARLLSALVAILLGWLALRVSACSRWLLLAFLLLPSTLFLDATCSQDASLLSISALASAILSRSLTQSRLPTRPELIAAALLLALCATARAPYLALATLLFLPALECRGPCRRFVPPTLAASLVFALAALWRSMVLRVGLDTADAADPVQQLRFLHLHPIMATLALLRGTGEAGADLLKRGLYVIGWNDLLPPAPLTSVLAISLAVILFSAPRHLLRTWGGRLLLVVGVLAPLLGISLAEYIIWTPPGHTTVYGIQPRYWLPVLPFCFLLAAGGGQGRVTPLRTRLLLAASAVIISVASTLPWLAARAFYLDTVGVALRLNLQ